MAVPPHCPKAELRNKLKKRRDSFVSTLSFFELTSFSEALAGRASAHIPDGAIVAAYRAIGSEMDPAPLVASLQLRGITLALPHVTRERGSLRFLRWLEEAPLEAGPFGLKQPPGDASEVVPDVILTPLLGFDRALRRIGYGAGFYDMAFARWPEARRIGLGWSVQCCDSIPVDPWDVPLHTVVTEKEIFSA